jgi:membrane-associated phospholipid phosphatase
VREIQFGKPLCAFATLRLHLAAQRVIALRNRKFWLGAALAAGAIAALWWDKEVGTRLNNQRLPSDVQTILRLAETFAHGYGIAAIILSVAIARRCWKTGLSLAAIVALVGLAANLIKLNIARVRPYAMDELAQTASRFGFRDWFPWRQGGSEWFDHALQAFPSGHTAVATALAVGLSRLYPHAWPWFAFLAALAGAQRIAAEAHYLSDTLAGAALGVWIGGALGAWIDRRTASPKTAAKASRK